MCSIMYCMYLLGRKLADYRRDGTFAWARPDSKTQVRANIEEYFIITLFCLSNRACIYMHSPSLGMCADNRVKIHYIN